MFYKQKGRIMKKELLIASLMLTSPAVLAKADKNLQSRAYAQMDVLNEAKWIFESENEFRLPQYDYNARTGKSKFSHFDIVKASVHFLPVDSKSELFDFTLNDFDPIKNGDEEFEIAFKTHNLKSGHSYFSGDTTYYGIKKGQTVYLFDCDSTKTCDASPESRSFAVIKLGNDGSMRFVQTADFFSTPYTVFDNELEDYVDLGANTKYSLKK